MRVNEAGVIDSGGRTRKESTPLAHSSPTLSSRVVSPMLPQARPMWEMPSPLDQNRASWKPFRDPMSLSSFHTLAVARLIEIWRRCACCSPRHEQAYLANKLWGNARICARFLSEHLRNALESVDISLGTCPLVGPSLFPPNFAQLLPQPSHNPTVSTSNIHQTPSPASFLVLITPYPDTLVASSPSSLFRVRNTVGVNCGAQAEQGTNVVALCVFGLGRPLREFHFDTVAVTVFFSLSWRPALPRSDPSPKTAVAWHFYAPPH